MAVATPVLERKVGQPRTATLSEIYSNERYLSDEEHNARIKDNYARLMNPDFNRQEMQAEAQAQAEQAAEVVAPAYESVAAVRPYLVENARADAAIFRADYAANRVAAAPVAVENEEESEDLRPTQTTIQYKTVGESEEKSRVKINNVAKSQSALGKREKIIIATFVSIVIALFVLVIVNSAIIANINSEMYAVRGAMASVSSSLSEAHSSISQIVSPDNIAEFAQNHGMVLR